MKAASFSHVAITVSDFDRTVRFYWDVFGCPLVAAGNAPPHRVRGFFGVDTPAPSCRIGWLRVPGGATIEIFEFRPHQPAADIVWNKVGLTHLAFNVHDTEKWHEYLVTKEVEIVSLPERSPHGHTFFFVKDPDGNLIELIDLRYRRRLLKWLGPLGGFVFRHSMYRRHYRAR